MNDLEIAQLNEQKRYKKYIKQSPNYGGNNLGKPIISHLFRIYKPNSILDIGCGHNKFCYMIRKNYRCRCVGVDFAHPKADMQCLASNLPFEDNQFEWVTTFDMMEHLLTEEIDLVLTEFCRVAQIGLILSISYEPALKTRRGRNFHLTIRPHQWWINKLYNYIYIHRHSMDNKFIIGTVKELT